MEGNFLLSEQYTERGVLRVLNELIKRGEINKKSTYGITPLHEVCRFRHYGDYLKIIELCLEKNADIYAVNNYGQYPLDYVFSNEHIIDKISVVNLFLKFNNRCLPITKFGTYLLHRICFSPDVIMRNKMIKILLENGADPNELNKMKESPICIIFKDCVRSKKNIKSKIDGYNTDFSFYFGNLKSCDILFEHGAKLNIPNEYPPLAITCLKNSISETEYLLKKKANPNQVFHETSAELSTILYQNRNSLYSPIDIACQKSDPSLLLTLLEYNGDVSGKEMNKGSPLVTACQYGNKEIIDILIEKGANPSVFNYKKVSPLFAAIEKNNLELIKYLLSDKFDVDVNAYGYEDNLTPLGVACNGYGPDMVELLLKNNANPNIRTNNNQSNCIEEAFKSFSIEHNIKTVETLIKYGSRENGILSKDCFLEKEKKLLVENFKRLWKPETHCLFPYRVQDKIKTILLVEYRLRNKIDSDFCFLEDYIWKKIIFLFASIELIN